MQSAPTKKGLMIAAPSSGSGKTVLTLGLLRALKRAGVLVAPAKAGPDYIDPAFHAVAADCPSVNLDPWAMALDRVIGLANSSREPLILVEAMMGLYDGSADGSGSAADLALQLNLPVVMVVDAAKQSHSIAALVSGFKDFRKGLNFAGVILNKIGSSRHELMLRAALDQIGVRVFGAIPRSQELSLPERHLGLVQADEHEGLETFIDGVADIVEENCDLELLQSAFLPLSKKLASGRDPAPIIPLGQNIAIAKDNAFSFIYPHLLTSWRNEGVELSFFSPLADEGPTADADAVYLPGGYPELHCENLSNGAQFQAGMNRAKNRGAKIYGECGGYMVLGDGIIDQDGNRHKMLGLLSLETSFADRKLHLGYRKLDSLCKNLGAKYFNAHEFHYTSAIKECGEPLFRAVDALGAKLGDVGLQKENVFGSYMHLIDRSNR